jgi:hypothetical protein
MYDSTCTTILGTVSKFQDLNASLSEQINTSISYTNPVTDYLLIFQETAIEQIHIYTTNGQSFFVNAVSPNMFDLRFLNPGMYFVQENANSTIFKLIKQ